MANDEQREEEEVLESIYEADTCYKKLSETGHQYQFGDEGHGKSVLLQITWTPQYPHEAPEVSLNAFFNRHLLPKVKEKIIQELKQQAEENLGMAMTYTLFEWFRENQESLLVDQSDSISDSAPEVVLTGAIDELSLDNQPNRDEKPGKNQMTKAQKRKLYDRLDRGELPRGWNWVDVVKHLSQMGSKSQPGQSDS
ncbi:unnamed protein product [Darwinula stevensoni]|uniref:RWD domain-containing protein n=1 Tax=Darwinula stevensoni TaxID=69355 RepID=A0A7R8XAU9_9CRUS|nr:unnamed protein product [Darwinula stevensoni]CAG0891752.1 unnamed protein product [Darwinula stevensoni]